MWGRRIWVRIGCQHQFGSVLVRCWECGTNVFMVVIFSYSFMTLIIFYDIALSVPTSLPRVRGFWSWFGGVCSLTYCNGNFRVTMVSEPFNVILFCVVVPSRRSQSGRPAVSVVITTSLVTVPSRMKRDTSGLSAGPMTSSSRQGTLPWPQCHGVPDSKVHEAYMGPTWGWQDPDGSHAGLMNLAMKGLSAFYSTWHSAVWTIVTIFNHHYCNHYLTTGRLHIIGMFFISKCQRHHINSYLL